MLRGLLCFYKFPNILVAALDAFVENQAEIPEPVFNQCCVVLGHVASLTRSYLVPKGMHRPFKASGAS